MNSLSAHSQFLCCLCTVPLVAEKCGVHSCLCFGLRLKMLDSAHTRSDALILDSLSAPRLRATARFALEQSLLMRKDFNHFPSVYYLTDPFCPDRGRTNRLCHVCKRPSFLDKTVAMMYDKFPQINQTTIASVIYSSMMQVIVKTFCGQNRKIIARCVELENNGNVNIYTEIGIAHV